MVTYVTSAVQSVFRPSIAALSIAMATAIVTFDADPTSVGQKQVHLNLGCNGLLSLVCR